MLEKVRLFLVSKNQSMKGINRHIVVLLFIVAVFVMTSCATVTRARENVDSYTFRAAIAPLVGLPTENNFMENDLEEQDDISSDKFIEPQQGDFNLLLSFPPINFFHLKPRNETPRNLGGLFGVGVGAEYFYRNNKSFQLQSDIIINFVPIAPLPFNANAFNVNLTDNFHINGVQIGYGLNFARNQWIYSRYDGGWIIKRHTNNMLGLSLNIHLGGIGIIFRPSFFELSRPRFLYEHTISIDFKWKIPL